MKILHYALGFPPYRTGGLTKFCMDIMHEQKRIGYEVAMLWPGEMKLLGKAVYVRGRGDCQGIKSWELINPLPVSYDEGIINVDAFTAPCDKSVFIDFLKDNRPDVIHIHTLMGLYKEFVEAAKDLGIRTVFSVHDFFSICSKVTMFRKNEVCKFADTCEACPECNLTALSVRKIMILQSPLYRSLKDSIISKKLRKRHRDHYLSGNASDEIENTGSFDKSPTDYRKLREYYGKMISWMDAIHYNSTITKNVFERFFLHENAKIISISHSDIKDNRRIKEFLSNQLRLTYLGPQGGAKGFFVSRRLSINFG